MTYACIQRSYEITTNQNESNKTQQLQLVQIFVRNYAKNAIKLLMKKKNNRKELFDKISMKMNVGIKDIYLFLHGKLIQDQPQQIQLHNGLIFHMVNFKRVNLHKIRINCRRIQQNSKVNNLIIDSNLLVKNFMSDILSQHYADIQNYFLVYTGRQLLFNNSFRQQYVEDQSQILVVHKTQNLKSKNIQVKRGKKIGKINEDRNQQAKEKQKNKKAKGVSFVVNGQKYLNKDKKIREEIIKNQTSQLQNTQNSQMLSNSINKNNNGKVTPENVIKERIRQNGQKLNALVANKGDKKLDQQNSYEQQGSMPHQLYETAKFNSPEELLQFGKHSNKNKSINASSTPKQCDAEHQEYQQQQILIGNYDACSYTVKNITGQTQHQQQKERIKKPEKQSIKNQVSTRYGLVPKQRGSDVNRYSQEQKNKTQLNEVGIVLLGAKWHENQDDHTKIQTQIEDYNEMEKFLFQDEHQNKTINDSKGSKMEQNQGSDNKNEIQIRNSWGNNPALLATISSRYDQQELYGMDSLLKSVHNRSLNPHSVMYNGEGSIINNINSSNNSDKKQRKLSNSGSGDNPLIKNIYLTDSVELEENKQLKPQKQQKQPNHIISQDQYGQEEQQVIKVSQIQKDASDPLQQNWNEGKLTEEIAMKKRHNRVEVKDMIQTVSPNFYKPQEEAGTPSKLLDKEVHRSEIRGKKKKNQNSSEGGGHMQQSQIEDQQDLESIAFVYDPMDQMTGKMQTKQTKEEKKQTKKSPTIKRRDSQDIFAEDLLIPGNAEIKDKHSSEGVESNNGSAVQLYMPLIDLPMIKPIKLPSPVKFSRQEFNQQRERRKIEEAALKDQILRNISHTSSVYHQASQSSNPASRHDAEFHQAILPKYTNQMRDSFTSNVVSSQGKPKLWGDQSNRLSIGSIESQTLYMAELPESSGQLGHYYQQAQQNMRNLQIEEVAEQKYLYSSSSSNENMSNILGSEADIKHTDQIVQKVQGEGAENAMRSSSTSNMRKKNKVQQIENISSIVARKAKPRIERADEPIDQKLEEEPSKQQQSQESSKIRSPDVLIHYGVERDNIYEDVLGSMNEVNRSAQQPRQKQNQMQLCYSKNTEIAEDSNSYNFNVMQDSKNSNALDTIPSQIEGMIKKVSNLDNKTSNLDNLSEIKNQQIYQSLLRQKQIKQPIQKQHKEDSFLLESSSHLPKDSQKSIGHVQYEDRGDEVLRSIQEIQQQKNTSIMNIQSKNKQDEDQNLLDHYLGHDNNSSSNLAKEEDSQNNYDKQLHHKIMLGSEQLYNSFSFSYSLGKETKIDEKDIGINIGDMIMMQNTNALYNISKTYNEKNLNAINFAQQLRNQFVKQFEQLNTDLAKSLAVTCNRIAQQPKNQQKNTQNQDENLLLEYL